MSIYQPSIMMVGIFYAKIRNKTENIIEAIHNNKSVREVPDKGCTQ